MEQVLGSKIIGVCGGSGSGKTTLARELSVLLGERRCPVVSFDSYYHDLSHMTTEQRAGVNFDSPDSLDVELLTSHLDSLHEGREVAVPVYDFTNHTRSGDIEIVEPAEFVIIEGILLFSFPEVRDSLDYRVFVDCPPDIRYQRRLQRDIIERGRTEDSVYQQWTSTVAPMHDLHVEPYAMHAHFLVTYGRPAAEMARAVLGDVDRVTGQETDQGCRPV